MKYKSLIITLLLLPYCALAQMAQNQTLIHNLTALIKQKDNYTQQKERKIKETIDLLRVPNASAEQRYAINQRLFDEFKTYISDSAVYYVKRISASLKNSKKPTSKTIPAFPLPLSTSFPATT